jgi:hypothetical protein
MRETTQYLYFPREMAERVGSKPTDDISFGCDLSPAEPRIWRLAGLRSTGLVSAAPEPCQSLWQALRPHRGGLQGSHDPCASASPRARCRRTGHVSAVSARVVPMTKAMLLLAVASAAAGLVAVAKAEGPARPSMHRKHSHRDCEK